MEKLDIHVVCQTVVPILQRCQKDLFFFLQITEGATHPYEEDLGH